MALVHLANWLLQELELWELQLQPTIPTKPSQHSLNQAMEEEEEGATMTMTDMATNKGTTTPLAATITSIKVVTTDMRTTLTTTLIMPSRTAKVTDMARVRARDTR